MGKILDRLHRAYLEKSNTISKIKIYWGEYKILKSSMYHIISYCKTHPTCDNCIFKQEHVGCLFRNKSPKEW